MAAKMTYFWELNFRAIKDTNCAPAVPAAGYGPQVRTQVNIDPH